MQQWAVIACDQFTQDRSYWEKVREAAAGSPSALNLIFPEIYLADGEHAGQIKAIHQVMRDYLDSGVFAAPRQGFIYLERDTPFCRGRKGLVAAIDLEQYDWAPTARPSIRCTEGTVPERLPPRMDIRRNASVEIPHALLLIDDDGDSLLREMGERAKKSEPAYQGRLMMDSGSVSGWFLGEQDDWVFLAERLDKLACRSYTRYLVDDLPFLFAVGDGNHSLASAKGIWEEYKVTHFAGQTSLPDHPCRYAMVEIENIYDLAIRFEPIHRVVFGMDFDSVIKLLSELPDFSSREVAGREELARLIAEPVKSVRFGIVSADRCMLVTTSADGISTVCLQPLLDQAINNNASSAHKIDLYIDYIHGEVELFRLVSETSRPVTGILLPPVQKAGFFETVARYGPLPRKSFSMGEAREKRFYVESRKLFG